MWNIQRSSAISIVTYIVIACKSRNRDATASTSQENRRHRSLSRVESEELSRVVSTEYSLLQLQATLQRTSSYYSATYSTPFNAARLKWWLGVESAQRDFAHLDSAHLNSAQTATKVFLHRMSCQNPKRQSNELRDNRGVGNGSEK